jgi:hypothetical protein
VTALSGEQIQGLLAGARSRGEYDTYLKEFMESGDPGRLVDRETGILAGKKADQVKVGLENAKKRTNDAGQFVHPGAQGVKVIRKAPEDDNGKPIKDAPDNEVMIYVIDTAKVEGVATQEPSQDAVPA